MLFCLVSTEGFTYSVQATSVVCLIPPKSLSHEPQLSQRKLGRDQWSPEAVLSKETSCKQLYFCLVAAAACSYFSFLTSWKNLMVFLVLVFSGMTTSGSGPATTCNIIPVLKKKKKNTKAHLPQEIVSLTLYCTSPFFISVALLAYCLSIRVNSCNVMNFNLRIIF